jgi:hypothetical protein
VGKLKVNKGPQEVLRALATDDDLDEAMTFQRESFRAAFGCYPEDCVPAVEHPQTNRDAR